MSSPSPPPIIQHRSTHRKRSGSPHPTVSSSAKALKVRPDRSTRLPSAPATTTNTSQRQSTAFPRSSIRQSVARLKSDDSSDRLDQRAKVALPSVPEVSSSSVSLRTASSSYRAAKQQFERKHAAPVTSSDKLRARESALVSAPVAGTSIGSNAKSKRESTAIPIGARKSSRTSSAAPVPQQRFAQKYTTHHIVQTSPPTFLVQSPSISSPEILTRQVRRKPAPAAREPPLVPTPDALVERVEERSERELRTRTKSGGKENEERVGISSPASYHVPNLPLTGTARDRLHAESPSSPQRPSSPRYRVENWIEDVSPDRPPNSVEQTDLRSLLQKRVLASPMQDSTRKTRTRSGTIDEPSRSPKTAPPLDTPRRPPPPLPPRRIQPSPTLYDVTATPLRSPTLSKSPVSPSLASTGNRDVFALPIEHVSDPQETVHGPLLSPRQRTTTKEPYIREAAPVLPTAKRQRGKSRGHDVQEPIPDDRSKIEDCPYRPQMPYTGASGAPDCNAKLLSEVQQNNADQNQSIHSAASLSSFGQREMQHEIGRSYSHPTPLPRTSTPVHPSRPPSRSSDREGARERTKTWSAGLALAQALGFGQSEVKDKDPPSGRRDRTKSAAAELVPSDSRPDPAVNTTGTPRSARERTRSAAGTPSRQSEPVVFESAGKRARSKSNSSLQRTPSRADTISDDTHVMIFGQIPDEDDFDHYMTSRQKSMNTKKSFYQAVGLEDEYEDDVARNRADALAALSNSAPTTPSSSRRQSRKSRVVPEADTKVKTSMGSSDPSFKEMLPRQDSLYRVGLGLNITGLERADDEFTLTAVETGSERYPDIIRPATSCDVRSPGGPNRYSQLFEALSGPYTPPLHHMSAVAHVTADEQLDDATHSEYETEVSMSGESGDEDEKNEEVVWAGPLANIEDRDDQQTPVPKASSTLAPPCVKKSHAAVTSISSLAWSGAEEVEEGFNAAASRLLAGMQDAEDEDAYAPSETEERRSTLRPSGVAFEAPASPSESLSGQHRTWRSTLTSAAFSSLSERYGTLEMHRQEIIWELTTTESSFVQSMRRVIQLFVQPLRVGTQPPTWIPGIPEDIARLFDWLDDIVQLHSEFASTLHSSRASQYPIVLRVASLLLPLIGRLEVHQPYLVRLEQVARSIDRMLKEPGNDFGEFLKIQSGSRDLGRMSLNSWLLAPVQRLMKYPLLFKQLIKSTPRAHPDYLGTLFLYQSTDTSIRVMQEVKAREEEYQTIQTLASRVSGLPRGYQLAVRGRRLLAQGQLVRVEMVESQRASEDESDGRLSDGRRSSTYNHRFSSILTESPVRGSFLSPARGTLLSPISPVSPFRLSPVAESARSPRARPLSIRETSNGRARESPLYAFVFTDIVVLATSVSDSHPLLRAARGGSKRLEWKVVPEIGLARVLRVDEQFPSIDYDYLLSLEILATPSDSRPVLEFPSPTTIALTLPDPPSSHSTPQSPETVGRTRQTWKEAFQASAAFTLRSLSFSADEPFSLPLEDLPSTPSTPSAIRARIPPSPSAIAQQETDATSAERGERAWWSHRFKLVAAEMQRVYPVGEIPRAPETEASHERKQDSGDYRRRLSTIVQGERLPLLLSGGRAVQEGTGGKEEGKRGLMRMLSKQRR